MKRYYLSYNEITKDYYLDYGCFDRQREDLGKLGIESLISKLNEILPAHKQIIIYSEEGLDEDLKERLLKNFKGTRVELQFKKDLKKYAKIAH